MMREQLCMDLDWKFYNEITKAETLEDRIRNQQQVEHVKATAYEYNDADWDIVTLPHDFAIKRESTISEDNHAMLMERSTGWYRKNFILSDEDMDKRLFLKFERIAGNSEIYINGTLLHHNVDSYNGFIVDITSAVYHTGEVNVIAIKVDGAAYGMEECGNGELWYNGAGICRHVWLCKTEQIHVEDGGVFNKTYQDEDGYSLKTYIDVVNESSDNSHILVSVEIYSDNGVLVANRVTETDIAPLQTEKVEIDFNYLDVKEWSITEPVLYTSRITLVSDGVIADERDIQFGFRNISYTDEALILNGKKVTIKGVSSHEDHGCLGMALSDSVIEMRIRKLKELGCNAYICEHSSVSEAFLSLCDKYGIMVINSYRCSQSLDENKAKIKSVIKNHRNHPCIISYSIISDNYALLDEEIDTAMNTELLREINRYDGTRRASLICNRESTVYDYISDNSIICMDYRRARNNELELASLDKSILLMADRDYSEVYEYAASRDNVCGIVIRNAFGYRGQSSSNSIFDINGYETDEYFLVKAMFNREPIVHIALDINNINEGVKVYSNCEEVELFYGGVSYGRVNNNAYGIIEYECDVKIGEFVAVGYRSDSVATVDKLVTNTRATQLIIYKENGNCKYDGCEVLTVKAVDDEDRLVRLATDRLSIAIEGDCKFIGSSADELDTLISSSRKKCLHNGMMQLVVRNGAKRDSVLSAHTKNLHYGAENIYKNKVDRSMYVETVTKNSVKRDNKNSLYISINSADKEAKKVTLQK